MLWSHFNKTFKYSEYITIMKSMSDSQDKVNYTAKRNVEKDHLIKVTEWTNNSPVLLEP